MKVLKSIIKNLSMDYTREDMRDKRFMADQLRARADEDECLENEIFEVGLNEIVKKCKKQTLGPEELPIEYCDTMPYHRSDIKGVNSLKDSKLFLIDDMKQGDGRRAIRFTFRKKDGKYISLMIDADGAVFLSDAY